MPNDLYSRHREAIDICGEHDFIAVLNALCRAVRDCGEGRTTPSRDPAVRLIAARMGAIAYVDDDDCAALLDDCRSLLADNAARPAIMRILEKRIGGDGERKAAFHREGKRLLADLALHLPGGAYDLHSCLGGPAVSGEIILHGPCVYIQLSEGISRGREILYRRCEGLKDYTGGPNHFAPAEALLDPEALARRVVHELRLDCVETA